METNFTPLEQLAKLIPSLRPGEFMWMGSTDSRERPTVEHYKHIKTRRYLNLDPSGHAYTTGRMEIIDLPDAIAGAVCS